MARDGNAGRKPDGRFLFFACYDKGNKTAQTKGAANRKKGGLFVNKQALGGVVFLLLCVIAGTFLMKGMGGQTNSGAQQPRESSFTQTETDESDYAPDAREPEQENASKPESGSGFLIPGSFQNDSFGIDVQPGEPEVPDNPPSVTICESCDGSGDCQGCSGDGWFDNPYIGPNTSPCDLCGGSGDCTVCGGTGEWNFS